MMKKWLFTDQLASAHGGRRFDAKHVHKMLEDGTNRASRRRHTGAQRLPRQPSG